MTKTSETPEVQAGSGLDRRAFLRGVGLGAGAAGAVAALTVAAGPAAAADALAAPDAAQDGYRETAHVRRYYDLARF
ncbi:hypothetical protein ACM64Y_11180 [Novispirillum sp. DQ9]|uniref:hypothetical protein n=1 Tax=Novispirillum sp. DQ9 TaxID=3398612 RepID=UPI003C7B3EC5